MKTNIVHTYIYIVQIQEVNLNIYILCHIMCIRPLVLNIYLDFMRCFFIYSSSSSSTTTKAMSYMKFDVGIASLKRHATADRVSTRSRNIYTE